MLVMSFLKSSTCQSCIGFTIVVFISDSCLIGSILFEKKMVGHVTFRLLGLPSYSSALGDPLFGSTVFDDNGSILFRRK